MTSSTLLADPPSNETIDVFYIKKGNFVLKLAVQLLTFCHRVSQTAVTVDRQTDKIWQQSRLLGRIKKFVTKRITSQNLGDLFARRRLGCYDDGVSSAEIFPEKI